MNVLTVLLQAPAGAAGGGSMMWIMLIAMFTAGGIHGTIKEITDDYIVLEIASNVKIKIDKNSIFADASAASNQSK